MMRIINYKNRNWIIVCYYIFDALTYYFLFLRPFLYPLRLILIIDIISNIKYSTRSQKISVTIFFCLFMLALIIGLIKGNYDVYLLTDIFTFSLFLFLSFDSSNFNRTYEDLIDKIKIIQPICILITIYFIYKTGFSVGDLGHRVIFDSEEGNLGLLARPLKLGLLISPFALSNSRKDLSVLASVVLMLIIGLMTLTKSVVLISLFALCINLFLRELSYKKIIFVVIIGILFFSITIYYLNINVENQINSLLFRLDVDDITSGRSTELERYFEYSTLEELIFGRGLGGSHNYADWSWNFEHGVPFCHYGFLNLIMKGGFIYLIILYITIVRSMSIMYRRKMIGGIFVLLLYFIMDFGHTIFSTYPLVLFLFATISYGLSANYRQKIR